MGLSTSGFQRLAGDPTVSVRWFSGGRANPLQAFADFAVLEGGSMASVEFTKTFTQDQYEDGLESWGWLSLTDKTPVLSTLFGDLFLTSKDGSGVWFLDSITGTATRVWADEREMAAGLSTSDVQDRFLLRDLAQEAERQGLVLAADQVYDFKHPPALGGSPEVTNIAMMSFVVSLNISGQLHDQIRDLAPGTRVSGFSIADIADRRTTGSGAKPTKRRRYRG